jgi:pimeloyl-ACP methyl ester carboxylesterase
VPLAVQRGLAAAIPGARIAILPESGHAPSHDAPEVFARTVLPFLDAG